MINPGRGQTWIVSRVFCTVMLMLTCGGCATLTLPPVLDYASWALSGISYIATGKGPSDHVISYATKKDCTLLRALALKPVCIEVTEDTNKPVWASLMEKKKNEPFPDEVPLPPRIFNLQEAVVVQAN